MLPLVNKDITNNHSISTRIGDRIKGLIKLIFSDRSSRNLFLFLLLNASFAFVELLYGMWTNSLGLICDSAHMFFDCTGLVAGLIASVVSKWKPDDKFSYGYVRAEILAGFVNGMVLLFVAFSICKEAVERLIEPQEVKHDRLFVVSILGLLVNLIGIYAFQHGHSHGSNHSGHHHHHHGHHHGHGHGHSHGGSNSQLMKGVFLHILADTLGSVGVIVSAVLMHSFGWMRADPICSVFIAVLVAASVIPLVKDSLLVLMQRQPKELDYKLEECYQRVKQLNDVYAVHEKHFWTLCSGVHIGAVKLEVSKDADLKYIVSHTHMIFRSVGVEQLHVQLDYPSI